jgi:hypothetical protein
VNMSAIFIAQDATNEKWAVALGQQTVTRNTKTQTHKNTHTHTTATKHNIQ